MKSIEIDEELYQYIASNTQYIGESASSILRRLLDVNDSVSSSINTDEKPTSHSDAVPSIDNDGANTTIDVDNETVEHDVTTEIETSLVEPIDTEKAVSIGSVYDYINKEELAVQRGAVGRFLLILGALYRVHSSEFSSVCDIRGRDRLYFANNEAILNASGSSTKPRQIPDSPYWVITNSNTTRKKMMLTEVAIALGYSADEAEEIRDLL